MPFVLLIIGFLAIVSAIRGTYSALGAQIVSDLKGTGSRPLSGIGPVQPAGYVYWVSAIIAVGAVGYYAPMQKFSRAFMVLILLGMVLANQGLFAKLSQAISKPIEPNPQSDQTSFVSGSGGGSGDSTQQAAGDVSSIANAVKSLASMAGTLAMFA